MAVSNKDSHSKAWFVSKILEKGLSTKTELTKMDGILVNIGMLEKNRSVIKDMYISKKGDVRRKRVVKSSLSATLVHYCILEIYSNSGYIT